MIASGTNPINRVIDGANDKTNQFYLRDIQDHKKIKKYLDKSKSVVITNFSLNIVITTYIIRLY